MFTFQNWETVVSQGIEMGILVKTRHGQTYRGFSRLCYSSFSRKCLCAEIPKMLSRRFLKSTQKIPQEMPDNVISNLDLQGKAGDEKQNVNSRNEKMWGWNAADNFCHYFWAFILECWHVGVQYWHSILVGWLDIGKTTIGWILVGPFIPTSAPLSRNKWSVE